jgi:hypothetical protein
MATISASLKRLKQTKPHEYAIRFVFGGACTALAGWVATRYGPVMGGLFLAFPAIFPAGATLIATHERKRKERAGMDGHLRGRQAAALDAAGACVSSVGLAVFGVVVWRLMPAHNAAMVIAAATLAWAGVASLLWIAWKRVPRWRARRELSRWQHVARGPH